MMLAGVDFTSRPAAREPITVANVVRTQRGVALQRLERYARFEEWDRWLRTKGP